MAQRGCCHHPVGRPTRSTARSAVLRRWNACRDRGGAQTDRGHCRWRFGRNETWSSTGCSNGFERCRGRRRQLLKRGFSHWHSRSSGLILRTMGTTRQADEGLEGIRWRVGANGYVIGYANGRHYIQHRVIWEQELGPIPPGWHIHHKDGNRANNAIENLECVPPRTHYDRHVESREVFDIDCSDCGKPFPRKRGGFTSACPACQQKRADEARRSTRKCEHCGREFVSRRGRYCSQRCVNLGARWRSTGVQPHG